MKKILLYSLVLLTFFSCIKLEENDKKYTKRKLQKMLEGTWEIQDYKINGVSYLDTFLKVNKKWNCKVYTFMRWEVSYIPYKKEKNSSNDLDTGEFYGDCQTFPGNGYSFSPKNKKLGLGGNYFIDSVFFFETVTYNVKKLENNELILENIKDSYERYIYFKKI